MPRGRKQAVPDDVRPLVREALAARGVTSLWSHQARAWEAASRAARTSWSRRALRAVRALRSTSRCWTRSPATATRGRSTSTRRRRCPRIRRARSRRSARRARRHLRRRHGGRAPRPHPPPGAGDPDESRHAARRRAASPRPVGGRPAQPALRRRGRGPRIPGRLRVARRQRAAAAAAAGGGCTARSRSSCSRPRRSPTRASWRARCSASTSPWSRRTARRVPSGRSSSGTRRCSTKRPASARARSARRRGSCPGSCRAGSRRSASRRAGVPRSSIHRLTADRVDAETRRRLAPYRAGYTPAQRREIERRLVEGELLGVSATDALELGIDIGALDAAVAVGFPGTVASLRQQWGRAGRSVTGSPSSSRARTRSTSTSCASRRRCSSRRVEAAILDGDNPRVLDGHVLGRRLEAPLDDADRAVLGDAALERAAALPELRRTPAGWAWAGRTTRRRERRSGRRRPTRSPSWTRRRARCWAWSRRSAPTGRSTRAPSTSTSGETYLVL